MEYKHNLYVLLTKTPLKTGKFLRKVTGYEYNHCSISFDKDFKVLYSFSRKYKNSTFYAGLVKESSLRYTSDNQNTKVKIFKIGLSNEDYKTLKEYINDLEKHEDEYIYNYLSCITYLFHKQVKVKKAYTCSEFTIHILKDFCKIDNLKQKNYYSIKELSEKLEEYKIYEGTFNFQNNSWEEDLYLIHQPVLEKLQKTSYIITLLIARFFKGLFVRR